MKKTVLITGATSGIGYEFSKIFMENNYDVILVGRNLEKLMELEDFSKKKCVRAYIYKVDFSLSEDIDILYEKIKTEVGRVDILINNAGISKPCLFTDISYEQWNEVISTNLNSVFYVTKKALQYMLPNCSGHIINISSMWGLVGGSSEVDYSASKAGMIGLTKALAKELGPSNINVNAIAPGVINTDMVKDLSEDTMEMLKYETPLMRIGQPEDIAKCALFLAEQGDFITGQVISSNGGFVI